MILFKRLKRYDVVEIIWLDAWSPKTSGWLDEHDAGQMKIRTVGIFWDQTKDYIYTYGAISMTDEFCTLFGSPFNIPKGCIKSVRVLK